MALAAPWIFCSGMPRSGSTWSYNLCRLAGDYALEDASLACSYVDDAEAAETALEELAETSPYRLVKTHEALPQMLELLDRGEAVSIYTHRHPLNAVVSVMDFFDHDFDSALDVIARSLAMADRLRKIGNSYFVPYEAILSQPLLATDMVLSAIGLEIDRRGVHAIARAVSLDSMKDAAAQLASASTDQLVRVGGTMHDGETLLHIDHVRGSGRRDYKTALTKAQIARGKKALAAWLGAGWLSRI